MQTRSPKVNKYTNQRNLLYISIWNPTIPEIYWVRNPVVRNIASCFCHHWKKLLTSLTSNWYLLKISNSLLTNSLLLHLCLQFVQKYPNYNLDKNVSWFATNLFDLTNGCKCSWHLINIGYKDFLTYSWIRATFCSFPTNEDIIQRLLNLGSNIKETILRDFLLSYFL